MKLWIDDMRPAPEGYVWCKSVDEAKKTIEWFLMIEWTIKGHNEPFTDKIELIDIDHDAGDYAQYGGDYIKLLDWLEETDRNYPIRIHSMNVVGRMNMEAICRKNGWTIVE